MLSKDELDNIETKLKSELQAKGYSIEASGKMTAAAMEEIAMLDANLNPIPRDMPSSGKVLTENEEILQAGIRAAIKEAPIPLNPEAAKGLSESIFQRIAQIFK
jgi:hypothetical protein